MIKNIFKATDIERLSRVIDENKMFVLTCHAGPDGDALGSTLGMAHYLKALGKEAVVIGRSNIVGLPVSKLLLDQNATVTIAHSRTKNLAEVTRRAEILVVAIGRAKFVTADMVSEGAVVIDVGVNRDPETGKLCGDVDFAAIEPKASVITPVPGGVGPMTITCLMENTIECFLAKHSER